MEKIERSELPSKPKHLTLRRNQAFRNAEDRHAFATGVTIIASATVDKDAVPYLTSLKDTYNWCIDPAGNDFWIAFDKEDQHQFQLSCRYKYETEILHALANYVAVRLCCKVLEP